MKRTAPVLRVLSAFFFAVPATLAQYPPDYSVFDINVTTQTIVEKLGQAGSGTTPLYLYVHRGDYYLPNPVYIRRPLFLHGGHMLDTRLLPLDATQPLFIVEGPGATQFNVTGLSLLGRRPDRAEGTNSGNPMCPECCLEADGSEDDCPVCQGLPLGIPNQVALRFKDTLPTEFKFEMFDSMVTKASIEIEGPGSYQLQNTGVGGWAHVQTPIRVDHPLADVVVVGATSSSGAPFLHLPFPDQVASPMYHLWQERGRVRFFGALPVRTFGNADFRIDTPAPVGQPHVIAGLRSEGVNDLEVTTPSSLVYVPPSSLPVDILMLANEAGFDVSPDPLNPPDRFRGTSHLIDYNAAGTVWLLANHSEIGAGPLAVGNAPGATFVALGNHTFSSQGLPLQSAEITAGNSYTWATITGCDLPGPGCLPRTRFVDSEASLEDYPDIPRVPQISVPAPLQRPRVTAPLPGMINVVWCGASPFLGTGIDETTDDTVAIQAAFDWASTGVRPPTCHPGPVPVQPTLVFVPPGRYNISSPLKWFHYSQGEAFLDGAGGTLPRPQPRAWIAGAGSDQTTIENTAGGSVFLSSSLAFSTIQGLTFKTANYGFSGTTEFPSVPNVQIEFHLPHFEHFDCDDGGTGAKISPYATQFVTFDDCVFDGGKYALGVALESSLQCDQFMMIRSKFRNAKYGYAQGGQNALGNIIYDPGALTPTFENNYYTMGFPDASCSVQASCCDNPLETAGLADPAWCPADNGGPVDHGLPNRPPCSTPTDGVLYPPASCNAFPAGGIPFGGTWHVLGATVRGTVEQDLRGLGGPNYFFDLDTDTEVTHNACQLGSTGATAFAVFHQSRFAHSNPNQPMIDWRAGGGIFFLRTQAAPGFQPPKLEINGGAAVASFFNLDGPSDTRLWSKVSQPWSSKSHVNRVYERVYESCTTAADCDNGCSCSTPTCDPSGYCWYDPRGCSDGLACSSDDCVDGQPLNAQLRSDPDHDYSAFHDATCDDHTVCTGNDALNPLDICDPSQPAKDAAGCTYPFNPTSLCPSCPSTQACHGSLCQQGPPSQCSWTYAVVPTNDCYGPSGYFSCFDGDYYGGDVARKTCPCSGSRGCPAQSKSLACADCSSGHCGDHLACNGEESCGPNGCVAGTSLCEAGNDCVEFVGPSAGPEFHCLDSCPAPQWCATPPFSGPGCILSLQNYGSACLSSYGAVLGCPEGQVIRLSTCCGGVGGGLYWYCAADEGVATCGL